MPESVLCLYEVVGRSVWLILIWIRFVITVISQLATHFGANTTCTTFGNHYYYYFALLAVAINKPILRLSYTQMKEVLIQANKWYSIFVPIDVYRSLFTLSRLRCGYRTSVEKSWILIEMLAMSHETWQIGGKLIAFQHKILYLAHSAGLFAISQFRWTLRRFGRSSLMNRYEVNRV